jgi:excisionase family DNA binding protein
MSDLPDFLTVEEAARVLRIGRTAAYEQTKRFEETEGQEGIPVIRVGRLMRVPRAALERWSGGPLSVSLREQVSQPEKPTPTRRRSKARLSQDGLPFGT